MKKNYILHIKVDPTKRPNKMHLEVQQHYRGEIYPDKTKYNRKKKHKSLDI